MREILQMDRIMEKLTILSAAARYDVAIFIHKLLTLCSQKCIFNID